jgi:hypothetical protein
VLVRLTKRVFDSVLVLCGVVVMSAILCSVFSLILGYDVLMLFIENLGIV